VLRNYLNAVQNLGLFIYKGKEYQVGSGAPGSLIRDFRAELNAIQWGEAEDIHNWLHTV